MEANDERVQAKPHRDATDDGLSDDARQHDDRHDPEVAPSLAQTPHRPDDGQRGNRQHASEGAVAELDDAVDAHFWRGHD